MEGQELMTLYERAVDALNRDLPLTCGEVAALLRVDSKTVNRWARSGMIDSWRTLGGHHRFHARTVRELLKGGPGDAVPGLERVG